MKQTLLKKTILTLFFACIMTCAALAQKTVYGCMPGSLNYSMASFDLDAVNTSTAAATTVLFDMPTVEDMRCGTSAGELYYAFYSDADTYKYSFGSFNFTTGEVVKLREWGTSENVNVIGLAYDEKAAKLYALNRNNEFDAEGKLVSTSQLVEVNPATGDMTVLAEYEYDSSYDAFVGDANGGFYWVHNVKSGFSLKPTLYHIDSELKLETIVTNDELTASYNYYNSAILSDDKVIYLNSTSVYAFDINAKTIEKIGTLQKYLTGLTFTKSSASAEATPVKKPVTRLLVRETRFGDSMGYSDPNQDMNKVEYYYDANLNLSRVIEAGRGFNDTTHTATDYVLTYYIKYNYNDNNKLTGKDRYQSGLYDFGDKALKKTSSETLEYDEKGQLISETDGSYVYHYDYNAEGLLVRTTRTNPTGSVIQVLDYSDFNADGNPTKVVSTCPEHPEWTTYVYTSKIEYDENGNKISELRAEDATMLAPKQLETWEYDGNFLRQYNRSTSFDLSGNAQPYFKTCYEMVDGNPNRIFSCDSIYSSKKWYGNSRPVLMEYAEFEGMPELTSTTVTPITSEEELNTVTLDISIPQAAYINKCLFNIFRDGEIISTSSTEDLLYEDPLGFGVMSLRYTDKGIYNGTHEYFVQPVLAGNSEAEPLTLDEIPAEGYCISNTVPVTFNLVLPKVTDLKAVSKEKDENSSDIVTFSWTNPEFPEEYGFISNDLYYNAYQLPENSTTDPETTSIASSFFFKTLNVYILTRYKYGKVASDTITVTLDDVPSLIEGVHSERGLNFEGRQLTIAEGADVAVFSLGGRCELSAKAAKQLSLDTLTRGAYIVSIKRNGRTETYKIIIN
ncbi:MAG: T9SS type A sorting domain-containing protein [Prevotella sp.]